MEELRIYKPVPLKIRNKFSCCFYCERGKNAGKETLPYYSKSCHGGLTFYIIIVSFLNRAKAQIKEQLSLFEGQNYV